MYFKLLLQRLRHSALVRKVGLASLVFLAVAYLTADLTGGLDEVRRAIALEQMRRMTFSLLIKRMEDPLAGVPVGARLSRSPRFLDIAEEKRIPFERLSEHEELVQNDPWGHPYEFFASGASGVVTLVIRSRGRDGQLDNTEGRYMPFSGGGLDSDLVHAEGKFWSPVAEHPLEEPPRRPRIW